MKQRNRKKTHALFARLHTDLHAYVAAVANTFSQHYRHIDADDLKQECLIKIYSLAELYSSYPYVELKSICKSAVYNLMRDFYRASRNVNVSLGTDGDADGTIPTHAHIQPDTSIDAQILLDLIANDLSQDALKLLDLVLFPSIEIVKKAQADYNKKNKRKATGELVMNADEVILHQRHYAEALRVSLSTLSRLMKEIRSIAEKHALKQL